MGIISQIRGWWNKLTRGEVEDVFGVEVVEPELTNRMVSKYSDIIKGNPWWLDPSDDIVTINFANYISQVTAGLVTLDIAVKMPQDSARGAYLQNIADYMVCNMNHTVTKALGNVGIIIKPNGENVDYISPSDFYVTDADSNGNITGCVFRSKMLYVDKKFYTRYEWQRFEYVNGTKLYHITNIAYKSDSKGDRGKPCSLREIPQWANLPEDAYFDGIERPLFALYKNPAPNFQNPDSVLGMPVWGNCEQELRALDIAFSRKADEIEDSKHMTFVPESAIRFARNGKTRLPRFMKGLQIGGDLGAGEINEHVATLLTSQRIDDINSTLSMISTKCGFDQGFFELNERTGMMTATQVEANNQSTIRTIKNLRDPLQDCVLNVLYGASKLADIQTNIPAENWSNSFSEMKRVVKFAFGDITYNYEEDKTSWWKYRCQGDIPPWMYYVRFENMSEDEAKKMIEEAQTPEPTLFAEEE